MVRSGNHKAVGRSARRRQTVVPTCHDRRRMKIFHRLLLNALVSGVMTSFLWFALTFWIYLETRSVLATSVIGGAFTIFSAALGVLFGTFVDRHRKWTSMFLASVLTLIAYTIARPKSWWPRTTRWCRSAPSTSGCSSR